MKLSKRLTCVADLVSQGHIAADVGCDHAMVPIYLVKNGIVPYAYATDVNRGPAERAREAVKAAGLSELITVLCCDGLTGLTPGDVQTVIMAGMGGPLMADILAASKEVCLSAEEFILEPQSETGAFRHFLSENGYRIVSEDMILEDGKYYPVMKCVHGSMRFDSEVFYEYGPLLIRDKHPTLLRFLRRQEKNLTALLHTLSGAEPSESVSARQISAGHELTLVKEAIRRIEG
ncbi:MAG: class I SAM-dependent methyltransferase [Lachnospiraceae bacterium]|nr:class I SAM-dependent methyltransferase [Lachnospiraceae bacterium]